MSNNGTRRGPDAGYSFVEAVVTVALAAVLLLPLLAAVRTSVRSSRISYDAAQVETALINVSDQLMRSTMECVTPYGDETTFGLPSAEWSLSIASAHLASASVLSDATWNSATPCDVDPSTRNVQRLTLTLTSKEHGITRTMEVVKTDG